MQDNDPLKTLDQKLKAIENEEQQEDRELKEKLESSSDMGMGLRAGTEMVAVIAVTTFLGIYLDKTFETQPLWLIIFMLLGVCTAFWNVYRLVQKSNEPD